MKNKMTNSKAYPVAVKRDRMEQKTKVKVKFTTLLLVLAACFIYIPAQSQVTVRVNTASQTLWGPVGYSYVDYYYLPEADVFYNVPTGKFMYLDGTRWVSANSLPPKYNVDLFNTYKVVVNKPKPYLNHGYYVSNYAKYKSKAHKQVIIRDSDEPKYYIVKGHPKSGMVKGKSINNNKSMNKSKPVSKKQVQPAKAANGNTDHKKKGN